ncbi:MAG: hypothetical protein AAF802_25845 [Planctomycetota bacterium]
MNSLEEKKIGYRIERLAPHIRSDDRHRQRFLRAASRSNERTAGRRYAVLLAVGIILLTVLSLQTRRNISSSSMDRQSTQDVEDRALEHAQVHGMSIDFALSEVFAKLKRNWSK